MMNREIKFRAWHKELKRMLSVYVVCQQKCALGYVSGSKGFYSENEQVVFSLNDAVLLQYTGLKDRNGKEIYESDVLKFDETENGTRLVEWLHAGFYISNVAPLSFYNKEMEVIGNIYENPELLTP
jgi:uncharacterized phage protein (TIGR01671 family)